LLSGGPDPWHAVPAWKPDTWHPVAVLPSGTLKVPACDRQSLSIRAVTDTFSGSAEDTVPPQQPLLFISANTMITPAKTIATASLPPPNTLMISPLLMGA
jgi:hypothetical protein